MYRLGDYHFCMCRVGVRSDILGNGVGNRTRNRMGSRTERSLRSDVRSVRNESVTTETPFSWSIANTCIFHVDSTDKQMDFNRISTTFIKNKRISTGFQPDFNKISTTDTLSKRISTVGKRSQ
jgi:hypothetical protein